MLQRICGGKFGHAEQLVPIHRSRLSPSFLVSVDAVTYEVKKLTEKETSHHSAICLGHTVHEPNYDLDNG